ncbi:TRIO and F-actin-binding protein [Struthio camelus]|uniref:TRIO and F-actin-binding protein n=1 Tax=Struthio camelus TaxID=8801 RepID=UPI003603C736
MSPGSTSAKASLSLVWTMSGLLDDVPCESFEANTFAKSLCQHCFRAAGAHQHAGQEHAVEARGHEAGSSTDPGGPWDTICIVAPQCEVYVSVGPADESERWDEGWTYPPLSPRAEGEHRETGTNPGTDPRTCADTISTLTRDREMTRLWDSVLGSGKRDMMNYTGHKEEVRTRALQADRARWGQPVPSAPWARTESQSFRKEICPLKAEYGPTGQKPEESWEKRRKENSYSSLEHRKSDPPWASSPPRASRSPSPARSDPPGTGGHLVFSSGSPTREPSGRPSSGGTDGRHGLERQAYTALADLPKPKRLSHREAFDRNSSRTLSPGRVEVERIFGCERRKSETLEAFQALEEGRVDRLDGKTPMPPSKGRVARRQSSPTLAKELLPCSPLCLSQGQRLSRHLEQHSRDLKGSLRSPSPARHLERNSKSLGDPLHPMSPTPRAERDWRKPRESVSPVRQLERDSKSLRSTSPARRSERRIGEATSPPQHPEKDWRSRVESLRPTSLEKHAERDRAAWQTGSTGKHMDRKSRGDSLHPVSLGRSSDNSSLSRTGPLRLVSPRRQAESTWKSQKQIAPAGPVRSAEGKWMKSREPLHAGGSGKRPECGWQSLREKLQPSSPGKGTDSDRKGRGKPLRPVSPTRPLEQDWKSQGDVRHAQKMEKDWKRQEKPMCHVDLMHQLERDWMSPARCLDAGPRPDNNWKRPESPAQRLEDDRKGPEPARASNNPEKPLESDWANKKNFIYHTQLGGGSLPPQSSASSPGSQHPYLNASEKHNKPDLLNFKKGWMSILDEPGEWKKHWFVLTDSSLRYYRDSNAEEADDLDGEIDLRSCTDVTEFAVQRNYGFQIHTKDATFTLSAMTSGIRRNWIEALRKNVRPVSAPDVTKLSGCNKENSFRNYVPQKSSLRTEEQQRPGSGSEVISKGSHWKADGQRHAFDYVELSPLQQGPVNQGSPQRTRGSLRVSDRTPKHEDLERDQAIRSEERRKWFETPDVGLPHSDGPMGDSSRKVGEQDVPTPPLSEEQRIRLSEEIEKKWLELERLPLKDSRRVPLTALLNQSKGSHGDVNEALKKEVQSLRAQLESCRARNESLRDAVKSQGDSHVPRGYISQEACERSLAEMESSHRQVMEELQRHHQRELERLRQEKERLLAEEAAATAAAIEALKKAHREEMNKELGRTRSFQQGGAGSDALQKQHQLDVDSLKRELQVLSEQYSQKCLEIGELTEKAEEREQTLQRCQQEGKELLRQNQELQARLSEEIGKLRSFISSRSSGDRSPHNNERSSCELEVLLRVKENELQYLKKEIQCLREELQMMQKDKRFASGKYQDVYAELNHIKARSEREIEQLKEHLRLAMAALQEKESLCNSISE